MLVNITRANKHIPVKKNSYVYTTCTCGNPIMVWPDETVHHVPKTPECSLYSGIEEKEETKQRSLFDEN